MLTAILIVLGIGILIFLAAIFFYMVSIHNLVSDIKDKVDHQIWISKEAS